MEHPSEVVVYTGHMFEVGGAAEPVLAERIAEKALAFVSIS